MAFERPFDHGPIVDETWHTGHSVADSMRIAIIGGGAAGLMATAAALEHHPTIDLFLVERNATLGKKVLLSGGGRCNVTTGLQDIREVLKHYPRGAKFLTSAMRRFPPTATEEWFEAHGVPLKTESDLRVFPRSDDGHDIVNVFTRLFASSDAHVKIMLDHHVIAIRTDGRCFFIDFKNQKQLIVDRVILTTGGQAYRQTGSTGDGYAFAETLGHTITPLAPSLNSFVTQETWPKKLSGVSFERARITASFSSYPSYSGPFLFTHKGISGPAVFALSGLIAFETFDALHPMNVTIDLFPDELEKDLVKRLTDSFHANGKKDVRNVLAGFVPKSMAEMICTQAVIKSDSNAADLNKAQIGTIVSRLKNIALHVIGRGAGDEFVTAGGIRLSEVNQATMESTICPGLFFAGEILDVDGYTGGFNLQASWATGRRAGECAAAPRTTSLPKAQARESPPQVGDAFPDRNQADSRKKMP